MQQLANVNYLAVLVAAVAAWIVGGVWYTILSKPWMAAQGKTMEECKAEQAAKGASAFLPFVLVFISDLIMAVMLYGVMVHVGPFTIRSGLISGALIWFGFVVTAISANYAFQGRKPMLTVIDSGHWLTVLLVIGAILGAFGR
ncbi:MAG TPA: DUF1761 domain-containing protein [Pseudorhodoplanes sp.]|nr:DUF1761 domain-containing protein [Pseudorhodoplanes sp.]